MKQVKGEIVVGDKTLTATEIDYDSYSSESGSITLNDKTYTTTKVVGIENNNQK